MDLNIDVALNTIANDGSCMSNPELEFRFWNPGARRSETHWSSNRPASAP